MLFQRLNYFLISIAFLITAFVGLAVNGFISLALLVGITGVLLSWLYTAINYHGSKVLKMICEHTNLLESKFFKDNDTIEFNELPYNYMYAQAYLDENKFSPKTLYESLKESARIEFGGKQDGGDKKKSKISSPHTWIIPYWFAVFWLIALIIYIFFSLKPTWGGWIPSFVLFCVLIMRIVHRCKARGH